MILATFLNFAGPDLFIILAIMTFLFGAKKLPELARGAGEAMREFTKAKDEITRPPSPPSPPASLE
jgi:sec-independent protein translocase protein TatA